MDISTMMTAGHVEQLAKMSRLPKPSTDFHPKVIPAVKLRNVSYRPPETGKENSIKQKHELSTDSNTDIDTPRLPTQSESNKQFFQKPEVPDNEDVLSVDERSQLERLHNKLRQREKQRRQQEENYDPRKENRRRRILTRRERDRRRQTYYDSQDDIMSEVDFRHLRGYNSGRSGCSTPGGSVDEMKLGRNMRAAPRRIESKDGVRIMQRNNTNKDLIEILNRRQRLLQQQQEDRRQFLHDQESKEKAREIVNLAFLNSNGPIKRKSKDEQTREGQRLLDDAFTMAKSAQENKDSHGDSCDGGTSPRRESSHSAVDQLWSEGQINQARRSSVSSEKKQDDDFFDTNHKSSDDHMVKYVRDELQRLET